MANAHTDPDYWEYIFSLEHFPVLPLTLLCTVSYHGFCSVFRKKSKQAMRDYKKVQIQLENLETSVRDRCKKEFTGRERGFISVYQIEKYQCILNLLPQHICALSRGLPFIVYF